MNRSLDSLEQVVVGWAQVSVHPHRFGGREFRYSQAELGHVHTDGTVDVAFPRSLHDALLDERLAEQHHWVPNSGWISFRIRNPQDLQHALWLLRLSYLRYALKHNTEAHGLLRQQDAEWHFGPRFISLLSQFIPATALAPVHAALNL